MFKGMNVSLHLKRIKSARSLTFVHSRCQFYSLLIHHYFHFLLHFHSFGLHVGLFVYSIKYSNYYYSSYDRHFVYSFKEDDDMEGKEIILIIVNLISNRVEKTAFFINLTWISTQYAHFSINKIPKQFLSIQHNQYQLITYRIA